MIDQHRTSGTAETGHLLAFRALSGQSPRARCITHNVNPEEKSTSLALFGRCPRTGLFPLPVLRIFLYGPEHPVFLSLRSVFLCATKLRTRLFLRSAWELTCVRKEFDLASLSAAPSYIFERDRLATLCAALRSLSSAPVVSFAQRKNSTLA